MASLDDKKYVLYIVPTDKNCMDLMEQLQKEYAHILNKTHVQDVRVLPTRPQWLQFVPTFVERSTKQMYAGTDVMEYIKGMPQELTFDFVGGGSGKRNSMNSLSNGSSMNSARLNTLLSSFSLEDEQKTAQAQAARSPAPPGSRAAEQQRREAETQQRIAEYNASRQATMPRHQHGEGARMTQDRHFQVESIGPSAPGYPQQPSYKPMPQAPAPGPALMSMPTMPPMQGYGGQPPMSMPQMQPPGYGGQPHMSMPPMYGGQPPMQQGYRPMPPSAPPAGYGGYQQQPQSMLTRFHPGSTGYSATPQQSPYGSPGHFPSMY